MNAQAWVAAAAAVVAAAAFLFSLWVRRKGERNEELRNWQRVVIYAFIEDSKALSFEEIKSEYLKKAQQLLAIKLPRKEIQDDALRRVLLDLQKDGVIVRLDDLAYQVQVKIPMEAWALAQLKRMQLERTLKPKVLAIVERESGVHTAETLVRRLREQGIAVEFEELDDLLYELRGHASVKKGADGRLQFVPPYDERGS